MRKLLFALFFILIILGAVFLLLNSESKKQILHVKENINLPKMVAHHQVTVRQKIVKVPSHQAAAAPYHAAYISSPKKEKAMMLKIHPYKATTSKAMVIDSTKSQPPTEKTVQYKIVTTTTAPDPESMLKYVLFTVNYDEHMVAGETKTLELTMSPKSALTYLQKAAEDKKISANQIKDIEKVQSQYKYVSAALIAKDSCLQIQKLMPEEDKLYLTSINETIADQRWEWNLIAPQEPSTNVCKLSLFIRFCLNQHDCLPMQSPDKEFAINIDITLAQHIFKWFSDVGIIAGIAGTIISVLGCIAGFVYRKRVNNSRGNK